MKLTTSHLDQLLNSALYRAAKEWDDLSPLLQHIARDLALINGELRGSQELLKVIRKRHEQKVLFKRELAAKQNS